MIVAVRIEDMVYTYPTVDGGEVKLIQTLNNQCPSCLRVLSIVRNKENRDLLDVELCSQCHRREKEGENNA